MPCGEQELHLEWADSGRGEKEWSFCFSSVDRQALSRIDPGRGQRPGSDRTAGGAVEQGREEMPFWYIYDVKIGDTPMVTHCASCGHTLATKAATAGQ